MTMIDGNKEINSTKVKELFLSNLKRVSTKAEIFSTDIQKYYFEGDWYVPIREHVDVIQNIYNDIKDYVKKETY